MRKLFLAVIFTLGCLTVKAQNLRTFSNFELSTSFSKNTNQYSLYWGESLQIKSPVPFRFNAGLRYSLINKTRGTYLGESNSTIDTLTFNKKLWYNTFAIPLGLEFFYKNLTIGGFQEVLSFTGQKKYNDSFFAQTEDEVVHIHGFSTVFGQKQNLTGGVYVLYTFSDSFSLKAGYNRISSTIIKSNEKAGDSRHFRLSDDTFSLGIRLNIEK